jgi:signal transduction histidine kinase
VATDGPAPLPRFLRPARPDRTRPVNRNLITRLGLAGGVVAAGIAMVFLVMIVAIRDQRDATDDLRRAQDVVATAGMLQARIADPRTGSAEILQQEADLRSSIAGEPDQVARADRVHVAIRAGDTATALGELSEMVLVQNARSHRSRVTADDSADRAVVLGIAGLVGSTLLIAGLTVYLANAIVVPLRRTTRAAQRIADGDLTSRMREEGDAELRELARSFNRMAANLEEGERQKDEFFALVSHELRTPLTSIIGYLELVLDDEEIDDDTRRFMEIVDRNARRLLRLVGDMLFIAQVEAGRLSLERSPVDLATIARESVDAAQPAAQRRGIALVLDADDVPPVRGDRDRLGQAIDNLLSNAMKFTPEGRSITVAVHAVDGEAEVSVDDEGAGIPAEDLDRLFERFYRSASEERRAVPGVGLGLSIVKTIVEAHDGSVEITSALDEGTSVTLRIPTPDIVDASAHAVPAAIEENAGP